jgi:hypothetical protein
LSSVNPDQRNNGTNVVSAHRDLDVDGVGGTTTFFSLEGHREDPRYLVMNLAFKDAGWQEVGSIGISSDSVDIDFGKISRPVDGSESVARDSRICLPGRYKWRVTFEHIEVPKQRLDG